ncbi:hypothetical protein GW7_02820 [Heterocephalus glaber]|uniref:Uncharacterized protein n=1 Tax=Heterocephalus glaber TaxID=10181 RepID=G5BGL8_HETGA|nr:hypothetical protein GW7_02820 [Heterocephalus glaber]
MRSRGGKSSNYKQFFTAVILTDVVLSCGIEEPLEEFSHEPEPKAKSETNTEEVKPQMEEKNLEELEKSTIPPPTEPVSLPQEPPKPRVED